MFNEGYWYKKKLNKYILGMMVLDQRPVRAKPNNVIIIEELDIDILKTCLHDAFNQ